MDQFGFDSKSAFETKRFDSVLDPTFLFIWRGKIFVLFPIRICYIGQNIAFFYLITVSVADPDPVGSEPFGRIRSKSHKT